MPSQVQAPLMPAPPVIERLRAAMNARDVAGMVACFHPDYVSERPCHRGARHRLEPARRNWSELFRNVPDFRAELLRWAGAGDEVWTEWHWSGTHADGGDFEMRGTIIYGLTGDQILWARLYIEPVVLSQEL